MVSGALLISPHPKISPSPPYPFHGGVPHLGEVFLGTVLFLDGGHYHQRQEVLSLGGEGQCLGPGREGGHSQCFAQLSPPCPIPAPHRCGVHQGNHSSCNLSNEDDEEDEEELSGEQGS